MCGKCLELLVMQPFVCGWHSCVHGFAVDVEFVAPLRKWLGSSRV